MLTENFLRQKEFWYKILLIITIVIVAYLTVEFWIALVLSVAMAFVLSPLVEFLDNIRIGPGKIRLPRILTIVVAFLVAAMFLLLCMAFLLMPLIKELNHFVDNLPAIMDDLRAFVLTIQSYLPQEVNAYVSQFINNMEDYVTDLVGKAAKMTMSFISNAMQLLIVPVLAFYFLKDYRSIRSSIIKILPDNNKKEMEVYLDDVARMLSSYVRGMAKLSLIAATVITAVTYAMNIPYPMVLGLLAGLYETLPIVGPILSVIPAIILVGVYVPDMLLKVLLFYAVYYMVDANVTVPKVMGDEINLHPVVILFSLLIASKLFGIPGMVFAVPAAAFLKLSFEHIFMKDR